MHDCCRLAVLSGLLILANSIAAKAQQPAIIVVTGDGLPQSPATPAYSTLTLDRETAAASASGRLEDVLGNVAGFQQFRRSDSRSANPSAQGATLRALGGNAASRALVTLDGVPISDPFFGFVPYSAIAPELLSAIDVTRGGGSGPFGSGALAGTIAMHSAGAEALGLLAASALVNDRGESEMSISLAPEIGSGHAVFAGRWGRGQGFYTTPADERVPASARAAFDGWSANAHIVQPVANETELQIRGLAFADARTLRLEGADSTMEGQDISARLVSRGPWQVDALAYAQWRDFSNIVISSSRFTRVLDQRATPSSGLGGKLEIRPPLGPVHVLRIGADYRRSRGELFEDAYSAISGALTQRRNAGGMTSDVGLFAEHDWTFGAMILTGGVRLDHYVIADGFYRARDTSGAVVEDDTFARREDWAATWRAGALWRLDDAVSFRAATYRGLRLPTLNELYRPFTVFPVTTEANPALSPERLTGWEVGADWKSGGMSLSATLFDNRLHDAIANVSLSPTLRQRRNVKAIEARGVEVESKWRSGPFSVSASLSAIEAQMRGQGDAAALDGNRPAQVPEVAASLTARYDCNRGARLALTVRYIGDQFESDLESDILPAASTVDAFASIPLGSDVSLIMRGENLLDAHVVTRNAAGSRDIGAPRTIWLGLRYGY